VSNRFGDIILANDRVGIMPAFEGNIAALMASHSRVQLLSALAAVPILLMPLSWCILE
jgi:hypothetical protein